MSVLSDLFADIAAAIRSKNGEEGTMKPAQFPGKISALTVANAENTGLKFAEGDFYPDGSGADTITHGMGVVPDVVVIFPSRAFDANETDEVLLSAVGFSQAAMDASGAKSTTYIPNGSSFATPYPLTDNTENMVVLGLPRGATTELFYVGGGQYSYIPGCRYRWIALGNLFNA